MPRPLISMLKSYQNFHVPQRRHGRARPAVLAGILIVVLAAMLLLAKGTGLKSWVHDKIFGKRPKPPAGPIWSKPDPEKVRLALMDDVNFERYSLPSSDGRVYTCLQVGPDGFLYAGTLDGLILRFPVSADGTLAAPKVFDSLQKANNGHRLITGFCFEPGSTPGHLTMWVDNGFPTLLNVPDFTGKVTRISDPDLSVVHDVVIHLPRSVTDHQTNQPRFGPDGALYISQGCNTAYGAADPTWGMRPERTLNGTMLRLETKKLSPDQTIDALTKDGGGTFDPFAKDSPLTIYACGIRNAWSMVWTTDGRLYVPTNGSSAGGNAPEGPGVPGLNKIAEDEDDWLFRVTPGRYYGHPNPQLGHYVLNGGHPKGQSGPKIIPEYPEGTQPDPLWTPAVYDFGPHVSANGVVEYLGDAFGGKLNHSLIVCRFNAGSDLCAVCPDKNGEYTIPFELSGSEDLNQPLDVTEDVRTGFLYVSEYGAKHLTLMKPTNVRRARPQNGIYLTANQVHGQQIFNQTCIACHGNKGQGIANQGVDLTSSQFVATQSDQALADFIRVGRLETDPKSVTRRPMPPNGGSTTPLADQDRRDVVEYVRSLCKQPSVATTHEQPH